METSRLENFPIDQWDLQIAVGLTGAFLCREIFGAAMAKDGKGGVILNIASDLSVFSPDQQLYRKDGISDDMQPVKPVTYSVIKAGLIGFTRYLATYWADRNIRANAISPGGVYNGQSEEFVLRLTSLIPSGRMANRDEYRAAVQFLCSNASSYLNGQNIVMDGGRSVW
ncbi:SDR family oxidoreductase [Candidatus Njordibacter sp. Uisw_039]|uniref:SDR family oxidoreductase n=1 Tax=Candidatus Njordibacter sp. Uisw_039 TaxID=3230972 RepID=UPI003D54D958